MGWNSKNGDTRTITRFAFWRTKMSDGKTIWLKLYREEQIYETGGFGMAEYGRWVKTHREIV